MNRWTTILLIAILALLGLWLINRCDSDVKTERLKEKMKFTVDRIEDIDRIFVVKRNETPALLRRDGSRWRLDDTHIANPYVMEGILDVLENARIQYIPSEEEVERVMPIMATKGIKVEVYDKFQNELLNYYIGAVTQNEKGTHFFKEGGDRSYVMEMPYGEVNIRQRFNIRYDDWKTRLIFDDKVEDISSVKVEFPRSPSDGFIIENNGGNFSINPVQKNQPRISRELKPDVFEKYLISYKGVNFVEFNNEVIAKDSIMSHDPFMIVELVNTKEDTFDLSLWPKSMQISNPRQAHDVENPLIGYYAVDRNNDFGTVQHLVVRGTIAGYSHFFN